jgi:riboflavin kinase / FMN adenylyltransferase
LKTHRGTVSSRLRNPVVSIGVFDGVHSGHAAVFEKVRQRAAGMEGESVIVTFDPHPRIVLGKDSSNLKYLTTFDEKEYLISQHGIDHLVVIPFTREFARQDPCSFVKDYLVRNTGMRHLVFGFDHHFGHKRQGNYENLKECAALYGFTLEQLEPVFAGSNKVSSSLIRSVLSEGDVKLAARLLSYPYSLTGKITGGRQVGRIIGYPTANIIPDDQHKLVPADGVYAVRVLLEDRTYSGMMNIGFRPTINNEGTDRTLEVHIIDFDRNLYNKEIAIQFIGRIRAEQKFNSLERLKEQLSKDRSVAIRILRSC